MTEWSELQPDMWWLLIMSAIGWVVLYYCLKKKSGIIECEYTRGKEDCKRFLRDGVDSNQIEAYLSKLRMFQPYDHGMRDALNEHLQRKA